MRGRIATYRLQFRGGVDFDQAIQILPYLRRLGISHLYASPLMTATKGSTHGYDITDYNEIDPSLGGRDGFNRLSQALKQHGLKLLLDIVPNHMAASPQTPWWRDCAEWGSRARHARHFDIDWSRPLTLPILGQPFEAALAAGEIAVKIDPQDRGLTLAYFETAYPLTPPSYALLAGLAEDATLARLMDAAAQATPEQAEIFHTAAARILQGAGRNALDTTLTGLSRDPALLARLHEAQPWRYIFWQEARRHLSYRRFFEVTGLVGTRMEDARVFEDAHRLVFDLLAEGHLDGLRIDHVDGLADPADYLRRLRTAVGPDTWIVVEKILEAQEQLPQDWPIEGTTGYEFIAAMSDLFVPPEGAAALEEGYAALTSAPPVESRRDLAKRRMVLHNFEGELDRVAALLAKELPDADLSELREAVTALIVALPVYRTYGTDAGFSETDRALLDAAAGRAAEAADGALIGRILAALEVAHAARARFQQLTGPAMAKAVEDTLFYRHNALIAMNEVGCDPVAAPLGPAAVHRIMLERQRLQPQGLSATATHDTKRGEDSRARLYALAQNPAPWMAAVARWREAAADHVKDGAPGPGMEWTIYQALAGIWPDTPEPPEPQALGDLRARFTEYLVKAAREAKLRTSWILQDADYEAAVTGYAQTLLSPGNMDFVQDFHATLAPYAAAGRVISLAQTLVKLTAPGIPDIYQGSEGGDFSLVDPDNRRAVDFAALAALCDAPLWSGGAEKLHLIRAVLADRARHPRLFSDGAYYPLGVVGPRADDVFAFSRQAEDAQAVTVVPTRTMNPDHGSWAGTVVLVPGSFGPMRDRLGARAEMLEGAELPLDRLFAQHPVAFLIAEGA